jgi:taurine dioxygenase
LKPALRAEMEDPAMEIAHAAGGVTPHPPSLVCRPLSEALGAEIVGVDLRREIDGHVFAQILAAWHRNLVILLRDQELSEEDEVRFAERFGPPAVIHTRQFVRGHPAVMLITNIRENGKPIGALPDGEMHFHTDQCHQERPAMASMLYAIEVPSAGGNTLFANGYKAYETLPAEVKRCIDEARHPAGRGRAVLCASGGPHASRHRTQGALCQPPDDRAHRGNAGARERRAA